MEFVVLCDFDGTIAMIDTAEFVLHKFAHGDWQIYDEYLENGEITLEECMKKQLSFLRASKKQILDELKDAVRFRPNFEELGEYCTQNRIPLIIASAGLDFVIKYFLDSMNWSRFVITYTGKTSLDTAGWSLTFPSLLDKESANFKQDLVRSLKRQGKTVIFIGDGNGDYAASAEADYPFAIKGSKLARLCKNHGIPCVEIEDFKVVEQTLRNMMM
ncbi:MAG TPA: MtnX-like HAD-IB family phosphatase [Candidatus Bathyarchaeia archaeon]|nr:MAG: hypothetical protein A3K70_00120 [Candidatus Bathyarchaeota archaeon RBG_16_48_13]HJX24085.1 MtnX-like HAD-IB family phosphatase [Candidatus Bathyarchaeia archaeon]